MPEGNNVGRCRGEVVEGRNAGGQCIGEGRGGEEVHLAKGLKDVFGFFFYQALSMYNSETVGTLPAQTELVCQP